MTDLERAVARALRLSDNAATNLLSEIQRNIEVAKAELIRSGVGADVISIEGPLVDEAIITFCCMKMGEEDQYERLFDAFTYQQDNLRKS